MGKHLALLRILVWAAAWLASVANAVTSPQADDVVLVAADRAPAAADTLGEWSQTPGALGVTRLSPTHRHLWLARTPELADGHVRAVIDTPKAGKWSLLLRVTADPAQALGFSCVGLELTKTGATWVRWDRGVMRVLDKSLAMRWQGAHRLEVEVFAVGPHLAAHILDADTLQVLGAVSISDPSHVRGRIGIHLDARHPQPVRTWHLTVRATQQPAQARPGPTSPWRFLAGNAREVGNWQGAAGQSLVPVATLADGRQVVRTDVVALERLRRLQLAPEVLAVDAPFAWLTERSGGRYLDPAGVHDRLVDLAARHPQHLELVHVGESAAGRSIDAVHWKVVGAPKVLVVGGIHGDELISVLHALDVLEGLLDPGDSRAGRWRGALDVWVVPLLNPDGAAACLDTSIYAGRKNGRPIGQDRTGDPGVDLNRNFPHRWGALGEVGSRSWSGDPWYRGPTPASEPETQALMRLALAQRFAAAISFHTVGTVILPAYTIPDAANPDPDPVWELATAMAAAAPVQPSGRRFAVKRRMYPVDGVLEDWLRTATGTAAVLVEGPTQNPRDVRMIDQSVRSVRPAWQAMFDALLDVPLPKPLP